MDWSLMSRATNKKNASFFIMDSIIETFRRQRRCAKNFDEPTLWGDRKNLMFLQIKPWIFAIKNLSELIKLDYLGTSWLTVIYCIIKSFYGEIPCSSVSRRK
jgi:hypothetical protein